MTLKSMARVMTRRTIWLVLVLALVLTLALSACAGRGGGLGGGNNGGNSGSNSGGQSASTAQLAQTDDDLSSIMSTLESANQDMNIDESSQDNEVVP